MRCNFQVRVRLPNIGCKIIAKCSQMTQSYENTAQQRDLDDRKWAWHEQPNETTRSGCWVLKLQSGAFVSFIDGWYWWSPIIYRRSQTFQNRERQRSSGELNGTQNGGSPWTPVHEVISFEGLEEAGLLIEGLKPPNRNPLATLLIIYPPWEYCLQPNGNSYHSPEN